MPTTPYHHATSCTTTPSPSTSPVHTKDLLPPAAAPSMDGGRRTIAMGRGEVIFDDPLAAAAAKEAVVENYFGVNSFSARTLQDMVDAPSYQLWHDSIIHNRALPLTVAGMYPLDILDHTWICLMCWVSIIDVIANALRKWAQVHITSLWSWPRRLHILLTCYMSMYM
jgi:hypothetical protein